MAEESLFDVPVPDSWRHPEPWNWGPRRAWPEVALSAMSLGAFYLGVPLLIWPWVSWWDGKGAWGLFVPGPVCVVVALWCNEQLKVYSRERARRGVITP